MKRGPKGKYPWNNWFESRHFKLKRGKDYECQTHSMMVLVRNQASKRGVSVSIRAKDDVLVVDVL